MTVLSAWQSAAIRLLGRKPTTLFSSTETFEIECQDLLNEVAADIAKSHDWQALIKVQTMTGDGSDTDFAFPSDYARMLLKSDILDSTNFAWGYTRIVDINEFLAIRAQGVSALPGVWTMYANQFQFEPAPVSGATAEFPYIDRNYALATDGTTAKPAFTLDSDTFRLPERLLTLGLIWKWRANKGLPGESDAESNFVKAFAEESGRDKGARIIRTGALRVPANVTAAYPYALGP